MINGDTSSVTPHMSLLPVGDPHSHHHHHTRSSNSIGDHMDGGVLWGGPLVNQGVVHDSYLAPRSLAQHNGLAGDFSLDASLDVAELTGEPCVLSPFPPVDKRRAVRLTAGSVMYNPAAGHFHDSAAQHYVSSIDDDRLTTSAARGGAQPTVDFMTACGHGSEANPALWSLPGAAMQTAVLGGPPSGMFPANLHTAAETVEPGSLLHHRVHPAAAGIKNLPVAEAGRGSWDKSDRQEEDHRDLLSVGGSLRRDVLNRGLHRTSMFDHQTMERLPQGSSADLTSVSRALRNADVLTGGLPSFPAYRARGGSESIIGGCRSNATSALNGYSGLNRLTRNPDVTAPPFEPRRSVMLSTGTEDFAAPSNLSDVPLAGQMFVDASGRITAPPRMIDQRNLDPRLPSNPHYHRPPVARRHVLPHHATLAHNKLHTYDTVPFQGNVAELGNSELYPLSSAATAEHNAAALRSAQHNMNTEATHLSNGGALLGSHFHQDSLAHLTEESALKQGLSLNLKLPDRAGNIFDLQQQFDPNSAATPSTVGSLSAMSRPGQEPVTRHTDNKKRSSTSFTVSGTPGSNNYAAGLAGAQQAAYLKRVQSASRFPEQGHSELWNGLSSRDRAPQFRSWTESPSRAGRASSLAGRPGHSGVLSQDMMDQIHMRAGYASRKGVSYSGSGNSEKQMPSLPSRSEEMQITESGVPLTLPQFDKLIKLQSNVQSATLNYLNELKIASDMSSTHDQLPLDQQDEQPGSAADSPAVVEGAEDSQRLLEALRKFVRVAESSFARQQRGATEGDSYCYSAAERSSTAATGGDYFPNLYSDLYNAKAKSFSAVAPLTRTAASTNQFHAALSSLVRHPVPGRSFSQDRLDPRRPPFGNARAASFQAQQLTPLTAISEGVQSGRGLPRWPGMHLDMDNASHHQTHDLTFNRAVDHWLPTQRQNQLNTGSALHGESYNRQQQNLSRDVPTQAGGSSAPAMDPSIIAVGGAKGSSGYGNTGALVDSRKGSNMQFDAGGAQQPLLSDSQATAAALLLAAVGVPEFDNALTQAHMSNADAVSQNGAALGGGDSLGSRAVQQSGSQMIETATYYNQSSRRDDDEVSAFAALLTLAGVGAGDGHRKSENFSGSTLGSNSFGDNTTSTNVSNEHMTIEDGDTIRQLGANRSRGAANDGGTIQKLNSTDDITENLEGSGSTYMTAAAGAALQNFVLSNDAASVAALVEHLHQQNGSDGHRLSDLAPAASLNSNGEVGLSHSFRHRDGSSNSQMVHGGCNYSAPAHDFDDSNLNSTNGITTTSNMNLVVDNNRHQQQHRGGYQLQQHTESMPPACIADAETAVASNLLSALTSCASAERNVVNDQIEAVSSTQRNTNSSDGGNHVLDSSFGDLGGVNSFQAEVQALLGAFPAVVDAFGGNNSHRQMLNAHLNGSRGGSYSGRSSQGDMTLAAAANSLEAAGLKADDILNVLRDANQAAANHQPVMGSNFFGNGSPSEVAQAAASLTRNSAMGDGHHPQRQPPQMDVSGGMSVFSMSHPATAAGVLRQEQMTMSGSNARNSYFSSQSGVSQSSSRSSVAEGVMGLTSQLLQSQGMTQPQRVNSMGILGSLGLAVHPALCGSNGDMSRDASNPIHQSPQNQIRRVYTDDRDRMVYVSWIPKKGRAYNTADKRKMELDLKQKLRDMGLNGLTKVLLFPPKGVHCKLIFDSRQSAGAFMQRYGGENFSAETEAWKADMCKLYDIDMHEKFDKTVVKIEWSQK